MRVNIMTPSDIFGKFLRAYPVSYDEVMCYSLLRPKTLHIKLKNRKELVFTYFSSNKWRIDSMDLYLSENKKRGQKI